MVSFDRLAVVACAGVFGLSTIACGPEAGTAVGNGRSVSFELQGYEPTSLTDTQSITLPSGTRIDTLFMVVERLRLRPGTECEDGDDESDDDESDVDGPLVADLLEGGVLGGAPSFTTEQGAFCRFRLTFHKLDISEAPAGTPPELSDLSIRMTGARSDDTSFTVESDFGDTFELDAKDGSFSLPPGDHPLLLGYELSSWITALDLDGLSADPIVISDDENKDRLDNFEDAVKASARLFRDDNGDGKLSLSESGNALTELGE